MRVRGVFALVLLLAWGCSSIPFVTKPTGSITIERQQFIDTWAAVQVLFNSSIKLAKDACTARILSIKQCAGIPPVEDQAKALKLTVDAKIQTPEATVDWDHVNQMLTLLARVVL